jgi:hypothetical protein
MRILCGVSTLLKIVLLTWIVGLGTGFYAGQHVAAPSSATTSSSIPESAGMRFAGGGEFDGDACPPDRGRPGLAGRPAGLTATQPAVTVAR